MYFLFPLLSFSVVVALGFSYWFPGFLFLPLPFFLLLGVSILWIAFTLVETIGVERLVAEALGFLASLAADEVYD